MANACLEALGKTWLSEAPAMTDEAARELASRLGERELGRARLNVVRAFCSTAGYALDTLGCIEQHVPHDMDFASTVEDDRNYRAASVFLDLVDGTPRLRFESTTKPSFFFRPEWQVEGSFADLTVELRQPAVYGIQVDAFDDLRVLLDDDGRLRIPGRFTSDALVLEKTISQRVIWNTASCWRAGTVLPLPL